MKWSLFILSFLAISADIFAQPSLTLMTVDHPIVIDGIPEETWEEADPASTFIQLEPQIAKIIHYLGANRHSWI